MFKIFTIFATVIKIFTVFDELRDIGCSSKPVGDRGKKELPIRKGDLATFVITPAITALKFGGKNSILPI